MKYRNIAVVILIVAWLWGCAATHPDLKESQTSPRAVWPVLIPQEQLPVGVSSDRVTEYTLRVILTPPEFRKLSKLNLSDKQGWLNRYWMERNPRPDQPAVNPYQDEVLSRVRCALKDFPSRADPRPWDDRGEAYIRHGEPKYRDIIKPPRPELESEKDSVWTKEIWFYPGIEFVFRDFGTGEFLLRWAGYPGIIPRDPRDAAVASSQLVAKIREKGVYYRFDYGKTLEIIDRLVRFRLTDNSSDVCIQWAVRLRDLLVKSPPIVKSPSDSVKYTWRVVVYDENGTVLRQDSSQELRRVTGPVNNEVLVNQWRTTLPPGSYKYALSVEGAGKLGIVMRKEPFGIPQYLTPRERSVSDLMLVAFKREVTGESLSADLRRFVRSFEGHEFLLIPFATGQLRQGELLSLYGELYFLSQRADSTSLFRVRVSLVSRSGKPRLLFFDQKLEGRGSHLPIILSFSTEKFPPDEYIVQVEVEDLLASQHDSKRNLTMLTDLKITEAPGVGAEHSEIRR